jgi:hypothetical protein
LPVFDKDRLRRGCGREFQDLGARQLKEGGRLASAPPLKQGEDREQFGGVGLAGEGAAIRRDRGRGARDASRPAGELDPDGHGVSSRGGCEIGREMEAKHCGRRTFRE